MESPYKEIDGWKTDTLPRVTKRALDFLSHAKWLKRTKWYLAGGTALALYIGHRRSIDLDFFIPQGDFSAPVLLDRFPKNTWSTSIAREGAIYGALMGAKVSFIAYPFFIPLQPCNWYGEVRILSPRDIAVMKIVAVSQRGRKRDFIDLYWYVTHREALAQLIRSLPQQYPTVAHDYHHILKSLMYFVDADQDPMPEVFFKTSWKTIKSYFRREVPKAAKELLKLQ